MILHYFHKIKHTFLFSFFAEIPINVFKYHIFFFRGVKSSEGKKTNQAGVSAGCLQGADQTIKFQEDVITTVMNALKE